MRFFLALAAFAIGFCVSAYQYLPELLPETETGGGIAASSPVETLSPAEQKKLREFSADFDAIVKLTPPALEADDLAWHRFLNSLSKVDLGRRNNYTATTPLLAWFAYIAKHKPNIMMSSLEMGNVSQYIVDALIKFGLLQDWDDYVSSPGPIMLNSEPALMAYIYRHGEAKAKDIFSQSLFELLQYSTKEIKLRLKSIAYAVPEMSDSQIALLMSLLLKADISIDPRDIKFLVQTGRFQHKDLLSLMRKHAYSSKSMSSYKLDGARLGAKEYVLDAIDSLKDNASQPTNFYCAACILILSSEGLIGEPLYSSFKLGSLSVEKKSSDLFVFRSEVAK